MTTSDAPRYVVPGATDATAVLRRLARAGWRTREGFAAPETAWDLSEARLVLYGPVPDVDTVRLVVLAAARGAGVVAILDPAGELGRALRDDLGRLGPVLQDIDGEPVDDADPVGRLVPEQRALLERLANGETIAAAAAAEFLSLRTANRRIAQARQLLGVRTTREAVLAYLRARG
ncbi:LuxR family transcriptional regulator [Actinomycetes bacterium KLBMP 9797]